MANGGSYVADPTGSRVVEPVGTEEPSLVADLDHALLRRERHNFDPSVHNSRPDTVRLQLNAKSTICTKRIHLILFLAASASASILSRAIQFRAPWVDSPMSYSILSAPAATNH